MIARNPGILGSGAEVFDTKVGPVFAAIAVFCQLENQVH